MSIIELPPPTDPVEIARLRSQVCFKYHTGELLMAVDEKNPGRWELVKVYRTLLCWLLDEYAAVYVVSYGNGRTKLCPQEDLRSLDSLLRTNAQQTTISTYYPISKAMKDRN